MKTKYIFLLVLFSLICAGCGSTSREKPAAPTPKKVVESDSAKDTTTDSGIGTDSSVSASTETTADTAADTTTETLSSAKDTAGPATDTDSEPTASEVIPFAWCPDDKFKSAYEMADPLDQHRIILTKGVKPGGTYPVVLAFHGQPSRDKAPRDYKFLTTVPEIVTAMVDKGEIGPVILVLPVFRYTWGNWPAMNPARLKKEVSLILEGREIHTGAWVAFGHSGAAGCGGDGLNNIHRIAPSAVGFFDTCLGDGWKKAQKTLREKKITTVNIYSVETAGFKPRQRPEYQAKFDFGRAFEPVGLTPIKCPTPHPEPLRLQPYRCAATPDRTIHAFVVDTGEGAAAHEAILEPAIRFFLMHFARLENPASLTTPSVSAP